MSPLDEADVVLGQHVARPTRRFAIATQDPQPAGSRWPRDRVELFCFQLRRGVARAPRCGWRRT
ncbi:MAG TPA: hypothetical protein VMW47_12070 [Verrucomicrobiae bacterium]|nr:hypothetical protein [Verrucomicrobiae bacterium]